MDDDDRLPMGVAVPTGRRAVRSIVTLDALWVVVAAVLIIISSRFHIVDLPRQSLATSDAPYRIYAVVVPGLAILVAVVGAFRKSSKVVAAATGMIAPAVAGVGVLSASVFLSKNAAYADVGVAASLVGVFVGAAAIIRWFVYHPVSLVEPESRPATRLAALVVGLAVVAGGLIAFRAIDDVGETTAQFLAQLAFVLVVPLVIVGGALVRTNASFVVAGAAAIMQVIAVVAVRIDAPDTMDVPAASQVTVWSDPLVLAAFVASACAAGAAFWCQQLDAEPDPAAGDERWRWSFDD